MSEEVIWLKKIYGTTQLQANNFWTGYLDLGVQWAPRKIMCFLPNRLWVLGLLEGITHFHIWVDEAPHPDGRVREP